jgi:hypothetical protein
MYVHKNIMIVASIIIAISFVLLALNFLGVIS